PAPPPHRSPTRRAPRMTSPLTDSSTPTGPAGPTEAPGGHPSGSSTSEQAAASPASHDAAAPTLRDAFRQPKSVWAIAFAATVSFMGIGLVDPILPAISSQLDATPSQAMLLFTSYLFITALAMFFTSWFASKAGVKRTLLIGLLLVVLFAALAAGADGGEEIRGLRAGWGRATLWSSPPPWRRSSAPPPGRARARSASTRPRSGSGWPSARCWAACSAPCPRAP